MYFYISNKIKTMTKTVNSTFLVKQNGSHFNLEKDTNNCAVLALSNALNISYDDSYAFAEKVWKRIKRKGTKSYCIINTMMSGVILGRKVEIVEHRKSATDYTRMTLKQFIDKHPSGTYYILIAKHALVIKDSKIIDHCEKIRRRIFNAYEII